MEGREERRGHLGRRDGRDEVKMNAWAGLGAQGRQADKDGGGGGQNERRWVGRGWGRGRLRGPAWAIVGKGPPLEIRGTCEDERLHQGTEPAACWSGQGWNQGWASGGPCARRLRPWSWLLPLARAARAIQSFIRNMQEQAMIRRAGK